VLVDCGWTGKRRLWTIATRNGRLSLLVTFTPAISLAIPNAVFGS